MQVNVYCIIVTNTSGSMRRKEAERIFTMKGVEETQTSQDPPTSRSDTKHILERDWRRVSSLLP